MMSESRKTCNTKNLPARLQADQPLVQAFHRFQAFSICPSLPDTLAISKDPGSPWRFAPMQCPRGCVKMFPHIQAPLWLCSTKNASKRTVRDSQRFHGTGFCDAKHWVCFCQSNTTKIMLLACVETHENLPSPAGKTPNFLPWQKRLHNLPLQLPPLCSRWSSPDRFISSTSPSPTQPQRAKVSSTHCCPPRICRKLWPPLSTMSLCQEPFRAVYIVCITSHHLISLCLVPITFKEQRFLSLFFWNIIAFQCCDSFCWTTWLSHR